MDDNYSWMYYEHDFTPNNFDNKPDKNFIYFALFGNQATIF